MPDLLDIGPKSNGNLNKHGEAFKGKYGIALWYHLLPEVSLSLYTPLFNSNWIICYYTQ